MTCVRISILAIEKIILVLFCPRNIEDMVHGYDAYCKRWRKNKTEAISLALLNENSNSNLENCVADELSTELDLKLISLWKLSI